MCISNWKSKTSFKKTSRGGIRPPKAVRLSVAYFENLRLEAGLLSLIGPFLRFDLTFFKV